MTLLRDIDGLLQTEVDVFLRRWGDIGWRREVAAVQPTDDPVLVRLLGAVAGIEDDAFYMQLKLAQTGVLRWPAIQQFNAVWLTEEGDHGRAFRALGSRLSGKVDAGPPVQHDTFGRDPRAIIALPAMRVASLLRRGALGGYLVRGAMVEHVAIAVYGTLMRELQACGQDVAAELVRRILVQEGRHLRFFTRSAKVVLADSPGTAAAVRRVTERTWRPPGVDLYGVQRWSALFEPVLADPVAIDELKNVDTKLGAVPGFQGTTIVWDYLRGLPVERVA